MLAQENANALDVVQFFAMKVSEEINGFLSAPFTPDEVDKALFMERPKKSPGSV